MKTQQEKKIIKSIEASEISPDMIPALERYVARHPPICTSDFDTDAPDPEQEEIYDSEPYKPCLPKQKRKNRKLRRLL